MLFVVPVVLFDMLKAKQLACVSESGQKCPAARSLSLRRAWIEMYKDASNLIKKWGRSPYGERGLKFAVLASVPCAICRSPYGERGLKFQVLCLCKSGLKSLSLRRAWIEIIKQIPPTVQTNSRSPYGERGLKSYLRDEFTGVLMSLSLRRAWIEITSNRCSFARSGVALLTESVD